MAKYNVGDKVKVRDDLSWEHGASSLMTSMYAGKVVTISEVNPMLDYYFIKEDGIVKFIWSNDMFDGLADGCDTNPMPKLETGMFGISEDEDPFVVVGDKMIYQTGDYDYVNSVSDKPGYITALFKAVCFDQVNDGNGELIWKYK